MPQPISSTPTPTPPPFEHTPTPTPIRAVKGLVSYLLSCAALTSYLTWLLVPDCYLEILGLSEVFPQKYWAVAVPIYLAVTLIIFTTVVYPSLGVCITAELDDIRNVVDPELKFIIDARGRGIGDVAPCDVLTMLRTTRNTRQHR